jgi:hypothetical protein
LDIHLVFRPSFIERYFNQFGQVTIRIRATDDIDALLEHLFTQAFSHAAEQAQNLDIFIGSKLSNPGMNPMFG